VGGAHPRLPRGSKFERNSLTLALVPSPAQKRLLAKSAPTRSLPVRLSLVSRKQSPSSNGRLGTPDRFC
jgi:hypothetical protein